MTGIRHSIRLAVIAIALLASGFAVTRLTANQDAPTPTAPAPTALAPTEAEIMAQQRKARDQNDQLQRDFVARFQLQMRDASKLQWVGIMALADDPVYTFDDAVRYADLIVVGTVKRADFGFKGLVGATRLVVQPSEVLMGSRPKELIVLQMGGPMIQGNQEVLAQAEADPILLPGDRALLFLVANDNVVKGTFGIIPWAGSYSLATGAPVPVEGNRFAEDVRGLSLADFRARILDAKVRLGKN